MNAVRDDRERAAQRNVGPLQLRRHHEAHPVWAVGITFCETIRFMRHARRTANRQAE